MKEAWDFYISLFAHENIVVSIIAFTATLATFTFLISYVFKPIFSSIKRKSGKLKVIQSINQQLVKTTGIYQNVTAADPLFIAIITNADSVNKFIKSINLKIPKKVNGYDEWGAPNVNGAFPIKLEPGEQYKQDFSISALTRDIFSKLKPSDKVRFLVYDTSDKKYYSEKVKVKQLTMQLSVAKSLNAKK